MPLLKDGWKALIIDSRHLMSITLNITLASETSLIKWDSKNVSFHMHLWFLMLPCEALQSEMTNLLFIWCISLVSLSWKVAEAARCTGSSLPCAHRLVVHAGWILPTTASSKSAVDLKHQIIGCVDFWESFSMWFSGWLALFTPLCQHLICPHWCGMSVSEHYKTHTEDALMNTLICGPF